MERRKFFTRLGIGTIASFATLPLLSNNRKDTPIVNTITDDQNLLDVKPEEIRGIVKSKQTSMDGNGNSSGSKLKDEEIQHMVLFDLKHEKGSAQALKFLRDGEHILSHLPVVRDFQVFSQVSLKNDYTYGFSMIFDNRKAYETYNNHPDHMAFVENRWKTEVSRFLEIDFKPF
jgi:hypothetical protein